MAVGTGTAILIGRYVGAGEKDYAYKQVWTSVKIGLVSLTIIVFTTTFREPLMGLFTDNEGIIRIGASVLLFSIFRVRAGPWLSWGLASDCIR